MRSEKKKKFVAQTLLLLEIRTLHLLNSHPPLVLLLLHPPPQPLPEQSSAHPPVSSNMADENPFAQAAASPAAQAAVASAAVAAAPAMAGMAAKAVGNAMPGMQNAAQARWQAATGPPGWCVRQCSGPRETRTAGCCCPNALKYSPHQPLLFSRTLSTWPGGGSLRSSTASLE